MSTSVFATAAAAFPVCSPELAETWSGCPERIPAALLLQDDSSLVAPGLPTWSAWFATAAIERRLDGGGPLFSNSHMALSAAVAGQGFALALGPLVEDDLAHGRLVAPFAGRMESTFGFWFVCRKDRLNERKIDAFRRWIFGQVGRTADAICDTVEGSHLYPG